MDRGQRLREIRERAEKATPGPWFSTEYFQEKEFYYPSGYYGIEKNYQDPICVLGAFDGEDADFIAHAREDLEHEAREAQDAPDDLEEYADCFLLILDAARRAGFSLGQLIWGSFKKHLKNRRRKWARPTSEEPVFHTEEAL